MRKNLKIYLKEKWESSEERQKKRKLDFEERDRIREENQYDERIAIENCKKIVEDFLRNPNSVGYRKIDRTAHWYPQYKSSISRIVDFDTMKRGFESGKYAGDHGVHKFADDMRTMWDNALKFNHPSELIWKTAWDFLMKFEQRFKEEVLEYVEALPHTREFKKIIDKVWYCKGMELFHMPVDYVELKITSYPTVIKQPFCLQKVRDRSYSHRTKKEFLAACDLVFDNAMNFNGSGEVYKTAKMFKQKIHDFAKHIIDDDENYIIEKDIRDPSPMSDDLLEEIIPKIHREKKLTQEQLVWFTDHFYELDEERIQPIVEKLSKFSTTEPNEEEPTIDLNTLPDDVAFEAYNYLRKSLDTQHKMNIGAGIIS